MPDIEIKRGYEVLPDNNVRFGIRVINNSDVIISDVEVLLDYSESLFQLEGSKVQKLGTIPPSVPRTAKFILKPLGCIHKENISATIIFKDHQWKKHTLEMRPREVHCVCPFLKEKSIKRADFLAMLQSGFMEERGLNFEGIPVDKLVDFLAHTCKNRLYKVDEFTIENGKILYLAGDAVGEKAYYLLTAVVKEYEGLTQVLLREHARIKHEQKSSGGKWFFLAIIILALLALGYWVLAPGGNNTPIFTPTPSPTVKPAPFPEILKSNPFPFPDPPTGQKTFTNSIGMEFALLLAGEFDMGSTSNGEGPVQHTKISNEFYLGKYVVTQKQWSEVMGSNPSDNKDDSLPVDSVSWYDVQEFIKRLNQKEGTKKYLLPTEVEWEYAARAGTTNCSFGVDNLNNTEVIKVMENKSYDPGPSKPNPWGLYDMYGNFVEWMQDGDNTSRVLRNGWAPFYNGKGIMQYDACRASAKGYNPPDFRSERIGFRLLRIL